MINRIYGLVNPITNEVVYIGSTSFTLEHRLKQHYWHLNEVEKGTRKTNKRFEYLKSLLPNKVNIILLKEIDLTKSSLSASFYEKYYIELYRKKNPNLLNEAKGGTGGNTHKYKTTSEIKDIGTKISNRLKGRSKPAGFAEHLSKIRKGLGNPNTTKLNKPVYAVNIYSRKRLPHNFNYGFEINNFLHRNNAWSNVKKAINKSNNRNGNKLDFQVCYGYYWLTEEYANNYPIM